MPPFLPRKRSATPLSPRPPPNKKAKLSDVLDAEATNNVQGKGKTVFSVDSDSESDSTLSDVDSDQFEDVVTHSENPVSRGHRNQHVDDDDDDNDEKEDEDEDDDIEWEDAAPAVPKPATKRVALADGPIQLKFRKEDEDIDYTAMSSAAKKGPSRREKQARINTHKLHVQFLMWHNTIRNSWVGDKTVQQILLKQLPRQILQEIEKWKRSSGLTKVDSPEPQTPKARGSTRKAKKDKRSRNQRDWGDPSQRLEVGKPDMSHGDPVISLMRVLSAYWKKRFAITSPGLRKRGYSTKQMLKKDIHSHRNDPHDPEKHGEKIVDIESFRKVAETCEGSRDVGAQLFTALVRAIGIEARLVASLQPAGYGWTKAEQMLPRKQVSDHVATNDHKPGAEDDHKENLSSKTSKKTQAKSRRAVITLDTDPGSDESTPDLEDDDDSVIDVTVSMPKQKKARYDRDLAFPIYWTEVISPITCKVLPVSPLVLDNPIASSVETLSAFEPRGARAERTHQVIAYVVAHSSDGTAKDVTVRYLRKNLWPGKTKGFRYPVEKIPLYDMTGRIRRYESYDWFKHLIGLFGRSTHMRTATDDIEDSTDLVPAQPEKKESSGVDTLQSLKASQDFVLERFLRREEALKPDAKPDRMFTSGKGDNIKEEPVYLRADVERCLTAESWHKEGRRPQLGETPMKLVPVRAVTLTRKREAEEHERVTGEKQMQGLYSWDQTEWIIPEPIQNGVIPKNSYGNMDCFVPSMVPKGAVHIPLKGIVRICKKLDIDFAEAVTGFEFGNKRAVPVCTGVVVAKENEKQVRDAWKVYNEEQKRKEESKLEKLVLNTWKKFVIGLRIRERVAAQYGDQLDLDERPTGLHEDDPIDLDEDESQSNVSKSQFGGVSGGFLPNEDDDEEGGGFLLPHEDDVSETAELVMEDYEPVSSVHKTEQSSAAEYPTPASVNGKNAMDPWISSEHDEPGSQISHSVDAVTSSKGHIDTSHSNVSHDHPIESGQTDSEADEPISSSKDDSDQDHSDQYIPRSTKRTHKAAGSEGKHSQTLSTPKTRQAKKDTSLTSATPSSKTRSGGQRQRSKKTVINTEQTLTQTPRSTRSKTSKKKTTAFTSPYFELSD